MLYAKMKNYKKVYKMKNIDTANAYFSWSITQIVQNWIIITGNRILAA